MERWGNKNEFCATLTAFLDLLRFDNRFGVMAVGRTGKAEFACRGGRRIRDQNEFFCEFVLALTIWSCFLGN